MNNTYCVAAAFHNQNNTVPLSPLDVNNKHVDFGCFTSTVELSSNLMKVAIIWIIAMFMIWNDKYMNVINYQFKSPRFFIY